MFSIQCGRAARRCGRRPGFALRDLLACIVSLSMLGMLGCMWLDRTGHVAVDNGCLRNIRQLALATFSHESTLKRFPVVSDAAAPLHQVAPGTPTAEESTASGYSWVTKVLPYMEEDILYDEIRSTSTKFTMRPFDAALVGTDGLHPATRQITALQCPHFTGPRSAGGLGSEYDERTLPGGEPAITNYMAIVGTHAKDDGTVEENGVIISRCAANEDCGEKGLTIRDLADGTSKTVIYCESREPVYAAWIDGQATWVTGLDPTGAGGPSNDGMPGAIATLLNKSGYSTFALGGAWPGRAARDWGPSSEHDGGMVMHAFADGHAQSISDQVDPTVYYRLITRDGGEPIDTNLL